MADCYFAGKSYTTRFYCGKHVQADYQWGEEKRERAFSRMTVTVTSRKKGFRGGPTRESRRKRNVW